MLPFYAERFQTTEINYTFCQTAKVRSVSELLPWSDPGVGAKAGAAAFPIASIFQEGREGPERLSGRAARRHSRRVRVSSRLMVG